MTDFSALGSLQIKKASLNTVEVFHSSDDTNKCTLDIAAAPASDYTVQLPSSAGTLLHDADTIAITQLGVNAATELAEAPNSSDELAIYDADAAAMKKITVSNLLSQSNVFPSASDAQMLVADAAGAYQSVSISGDVSCDNSGDFTIAASAVDNGKLGADCVDASKIQDDAVQDEHIQNLVSADGTAEASAILKTDASNNMAGFNSVGSDSFVADTDIQIGSNKWKFVLNGDNLELQFHDGSSYVTRHIFQSS